MDLRWPHDQPRPRPALPRMKNSARTSPPENNESEDAAQPEKGGALDSIFKTGNTIKGSGRGARPSNAEKLTKGGFVRIGPIHGGLALPDCPIESLRIVGNIRRFEHDAAGIVGIDRVEVHPINKVAGGLDSVRLAGSADQL